MLKHLSLKHETHFNKVIFKINKISINNAAIVFNKKHYLFYCTIIAEWSFRTTVQPRIIQWISFYPPQQQQQQQQQAQHQQHPERSSIRLATDITRDVEPTRLVRFESVYRSSSAILRTTKFCWSSTKRHLDVRTNLIWIRWISAVSSWQTHFDLFVYNTL